MARLLRALRGLLLLEAPGRLARGCAGSRRGDTGRSSVAGVSRGFRFHRLADPGRPRVRPGEPGPRCPLLPELSSRAPRSVNLVYWGSTDAGEDRILSHACTQFVYMLHLKCTKSVSGAMVVSGTQWRSTAVPRAPSPGRELVLCPVHLFPRAAY